MKYSRDFIDKVVSASQLAEVISQYTVLKPAGRDLVGRCPFPDHKEKTPSFHVSIDKQVYHCFGCKKGGNVFTFLQHFQGMSFVEALEHLAERASIPLPTLKDASSAMHESREYSRKKELIEINKITAKYFCENYKKLSVAHPVREYTHKRYIKTESIETFRIGYATEDWEGLVKHLQSQGLSLSLAEELGLIKKRDSGGYFDLFRERLMFAITNQVGDVLGFGGRILGDGLPKYINSPESPLFHKGKSLYGLEHASRYIRSQDQVILVEGYMDLIALHQVGFKNVVAPLGTALTIDQCRILSKLTQNVIVLFDGDSAGQAATEKSLPLLFEAGLYPKGLTLPDNQDPDEFLMANSPDKMESALVSAPDLFSHILRQWMEGFQGGATDKVKMVHRVNELLLTLKNNSLKSLYWNELSHRLGVDSNWMRRAIQEKSGGRNQAWGSGSSTPRSGTDVVEETSSSSSLKPNTRETNSDFESEKIDLKGAPKWELILLALALYPKSTYWDQILHAEEIKTMSHPGVRAVFEKAMSLTGQSGLPFDNLFVLITNEILNPDLLTALMTELPSNDPEREERLLTDCLRKVRIYDLDIKINNLAQELKQELSQEKWEQLALLKKDRIRWVNSNP